MSPASFKRAHRVGETILRLVAAILLRHVKDPRVAAVNLTHVRLSDDLRQARIFFTLTTGEPPGSPAWQAALKGLDSAKGFVKRQLANTVELRVMPDLQFVPDHSLTSGNSIEDLLDQIRLERERSQELLKTGE